MSRHVPFMVVFFLATIASYELGRRHEQIRLDTVLARDAAADTRAVDRERRRVHLLDRQRAPKRHVAGGRKRSALRPSRKNCRRNVVSSIEG